MLDGFFLALILIIVGRGDLKPSIVCLILSPNAEITDILANPGRL